MDDQTNVTIERAEYHLLLTIAKKAKALDDAVTQQAIGQGINSLSVAVEEAHNNIVSDIRAYDRQYGSKTLGD